ncbi:hypothetical protein ACLB2K_028368 [Fragaria x ananassa]
MSRQYSLRSQGPSSHVPPLQQNKAKNGFDDDETLSSAALPQSSGPQNVTIKTYTETSAIPAADSRPQYPVLVSICAPPLQDPDGESRTPIDLVTVLDVGRRMNGRKLDLVEQAVKFVIENMGLSDRLSIVSFSNSSRRVLPLRRMTIDGRERAIQAVESLEAGSGTDIAEGLKKGAHILEERRERNPVASIILLSDGQDNFSRVPSQMLKKLPASVRSSDMQHEIPVHTKVVIIQNAFALCIGGLLSVVAQELRLTVRSASPGVVKIVSIPSGRYVSQISDEQGVVDVGNMYAEEEKQFLVYLSVPLSSAPDTKTSLLDVLCVYKDLGSDEFIPVQGERVEISRPEFCSPAELAVSLDVDRSVTDFWWLMLLEKHKAAKAGDDVSHLFEAELKDIMDKMASMNLYEQAGRAYTLSGMSSHARQRASARGAAAGSCLAANGPRKQLATQAARKSTYETSAMVRMRCSCSLEKPLHELQQRQPAFDPNTRVLAAESCNGDCIIISNIVLEMHKSYEEHKHITLLFSPS